MSKDIEKNIAECQFYLSKEEILNDNNRKIMQKTYSNNQNYFNLLNDYDIKQFKYSCTSFETNLINYKFIINNYE